MSIYLALVLLPIGITIGMLLLAFLRYTLFKQNDNYEVEDAYRRGWYDHELHTIREDYQEARKLLDDEIGK